MTVVAVYMGQRNSGDYWVNVKDANPKGMIGDAGIIRRFDTEQEAKEYTKTVNQTGVDIFEPRQREQDNKPVRHMGDTFELSKK